jgi:hypothetical protein
MWAGQGMFEDFWYGSQDGLLFQTAVDGPLPFVKPIPAIDSRKAVNGVAFLAVNDWLYFAATSRSEICIRGVGADGHGVYTQRFDFGAHGVVASVTNGFTFPIGPGGVISFFPSGHEREEAQVVSGKNGFPYFYQLVSLHHNREKDEELFVAACRGDGFVILRVGLAGAPEIIRSARVTGKNVDFVGVCAIGNESNPMAIVALGQDRTLHFVREPLKSPAMESLHFPFVPGRAYKLLRAGDHLLMLTSKGVCFIPDLVRQFQNGEELEGVRQVRFVEIEAIDFNIAFGKWLLVVTSQFSLRFDLNQIFPVVRSLALPEAIERRMTHWASPSLPESESVITPTWSNVRFGQVLESQRGTLEKSAIGA